MSSIVFFTAYSVVIIFLLFIVIVSFWTTRINRKLRMQEKVIKHLATVLGFDVHYSATSERIEMHCEQPSNKPVTVGDMNKLIDSTNRHLSALATHLKIRFSKKVVRASEELVAEKIK